MSEHQKVAVYFCSLCCNRIGHAKRMAESGDNSDGFWTRMEGVWRRQLAFWRRQYNGA